MLEPHVIIKAAHFLEGLVAMVALEDAPHLHVNGAHVTPRIVAVCEVLSAFNTAHGPVRLHEQLGADFIYNRGKKKKNRMFLQIKSFCLIILMGNKVKGN